MVNNLDLQSGSSEEEEHILPRNSSMLLKKGKTSMANCIEISCSESETSGLAKKTEGQNCQSMTHL